MRSMFDRNAQFAEIAAELFDSLVVALNGVGGELLKSTCKSFSFGHLTRSNTRTFLVENVLNFDGKNLAVVVELLSTCQTKLNFD